ncbi:hypothetical protein N2152v2_007274 [Parachlorella kessleri]
MILDEEMYVLAADTDERHPCLVGSKNILLHFSSGASAVHAAGLAPTLNTDAARWPYGRKYALENQAAMVERLQRTKGGDLGEVLRNQVSKIERHRSESPQSAAEDIDVLQALLDSWLAYRAGQPRECVELFGRSVQHNSAMQVHPRTDPAYYSFLLRSLEAAESLGIDPATAAAARAFLCVSDPKALRLDDTRAGLLLRDLAEAHRTAWWVQYAQATWQVMHGDQRGSAESLTRAILAGGPYGLYYSRGRTFSYQEKQQQSARDFAKFLELAPRDNRNRPDAYYALSLNAAMAKDMATAKRRFAEGEAAEADVAPWVGYTMSEVKQMAHLFLQA